MPHRSICLAVLVAAGLLPAAASAAPISGQLIVTFSPSAKAAQKAAVRDQKGLALGRDLTRVRSLVVQVPDGKESAFMSRLKRLPGVQTVEQDSTVRALTNDTHWNRQWGLENTSATLHLDSVWKADADIDMPEAWKVSLGGAIKVAVLDTGVDQDHVDLSSRLVLQRNFSSSSTVDDLYGHGTHVAGIIAAVYNNSIGIAGIAPNAQLLSGKVLGDDGSGSCSMVAQGITWAADQGAKVISLSLGGGGCTAQKTAVDYATGKGSLVVAAAGNSGNNAMTYPAAYPNAVAVAATDDADGLASFSNRGSWVDIAAPGVDIPSTVPNHTNSLGITNYAYMSGTSMAAPHVAGVATLVASRITDSNANGRTNDELRTRLESTADKLTSLTGKIAGGRLNACRAMSNLSSC